MGVYRVLDSGHPSVVVLDFEWQGRRLVTLHNLAGKSATARFEPGGVGRFRSVFGHGDEVRVGR